MTADLLAKEFEGFRKELRSYILRITVSAQDADDIVQDAFIKASEKISSFKGESSIKTWVFAIASNLARDLLRAKERWPENSGDICKEAALGNQEFFGEAMHIRQTSPQGMFEIREHVAFCFICISKSLPVEQQLVIFLKEVYGFKVKEIVQILRFNEPMVKYFLHTGRGKMNKVFDKRCSLINKEGACHQCTELNGIFNPEQNAAEEAAKLQLVKDAESGTKDELLDLRMKILQELDPFESGAAELQLHHLEHNRQVMEEYTKKS